MAAMSCHGARVRQMTEMRGTMLPGKLAKFMGSVFVAALVFSPTAASAQCAIAGQVKDTSGGALPGVTVEITSPVLIEKVRAAVTLSLIHI